MLEAHEELMRAEYDAWAVYYDWLHPGLPGEAEFYLREVAARPGPVLELGVGTGRISISLAAAGRAVVGLDLSEAMLALCREKLRLGAPLPGSVRLIRGDMRGFALARQFQTILLPYRTFMHLLTPGEQAACLAAVRAHLAPEGCCLMNLWAVRLPQLRQVIPARPGRFRLVGRHRIPEEEIELRHFYRAWLFEPGPLLEEEHRVEELSLAGKRLRSVILPMRRACITRQRMERLIARAGLQVEALYGGFERESFGRQSREMVWVLRRPSH